MTAIELLQDAVTIVENSADADEHAEWLGKARAVLNPPAYKIISIWTDKVEKTLGGISIGEEATMKRLCELATNHAKRLPNNPHTGISGANEVSVWIGVHRVMTFKAVKCAAPNSELVQA